MELKFIGRRSAAQLCCDDVVQVGHRQFLIETRVTTSMRNFVALTGTWVDDRTRDVVVIPTRGTRRVWMPLSN